MILTSWYWIFYLLSVVTNLKIVVGVLGFGSLGSAALVWLITIVMAMADEPTPELLIKVRKWAFIFSIPFVLLWSLIPSKKDLAMTIVGGTVFNYIERDSVLQQLPYEVSSYMKELVHSWKEELQSGKNLEDMTKDELIQKIKDQK